MPKSVIVSGARTPIGKLLGSLGELSAPQLAGIAIAETIKRAAIRADLIDYVVMGEVLQAGVGQAPARQAAIAGGIPLTVPSTTVNKVCLSGLQAIYMADRMIQAGDATVVIAGGMESMTNAPFVLPGARKGYKFGNQNVVDSMEFDGLFCAIERQAMGVSTDNYNERDANISRDAQDAFALRSHERAAVATDDGVFAKEIAPITIANRKGDATVINHDEGIRRDTSIESLGRLKPAFGPNGTVTAGNASQLSDGAASLLVMSAEKAEELGVTPICEIVSYGMVAGPDASLLTQPSRAIRNALDKSGLAITDIDLFEINEAFATVVLASMADLSISPEVVNKNGGAIALGHPIGMSGARLALTLAYALQRGEANVAAAALCGGGGQGDAIILRKLS